MLRVSRRHVLAGSAAALVTALQRTPGVGAKTTSAGPPAAQLVEDLVAANRILADQGVLDGYGHVSARHDRDPAHFLMSRSLAPELVTAADIMEYGPDSEPVDPRGRASYLERFIHGEIYRVRPDVQAVVHSHSPSVIPFGATRQPLRPIFHMSGFLGDGAALFDIREAAGDTDMLISNGALGAALAKALGEKSAVLMRGHGSTVVGNSIEQAVYRAIYAEVNARLQIEVV
jgi:HCOMODA/2-hydroxy-3-carboxy-muconic semialdehyde decarboxylase